MIDENTISKILIQEDPIGIYFPDLLNLDEYNSEAKLIAEEIKVFHDINELTYIIWSIFKKTFGEVEAGEKENYTSIAKKIFKELSN